LWADTEGCFVGERTLHMEVDAEKGLQHGACGNRIGPGWDGNGLLCDLADTWVLHIWRLILEEVVGSQAGIVQELDCVGFWTPYWRLWAINCCFKIFKMWRKWYYQIYVSEKLPER
jgi:hypothetical protein